MSKGCWEKGDLEVVKIVYKGKVVTLEEMKKMRGDDHHEVRTGKQNEQKGS